jgi:hypothetical protein
MGKRHKESIRTVDDSFEIDYDTQVIRYASDTGKKFATPIEFYRWLKGQYGKSSLEIAVEKQVERNKT